MKSLQKKFNVIISLTMLGFSFAFYSASAQNDSAVFKFKPSQQSWIVPAGVTKINVNAYGAQGGSAKGGKGGLVKSELQVKPGTNLLIYVGSQPEGTNGGYNGGGKGCGNGTGGGGASDIRINGSALENRILVAGGGGGAGYVGDAGAGGGLIAGEGKYDTLAHKCFTVA